MPDDSADTWIFVVIHSPRLCMQVSHGAIVESGMRRIMVDRRRSKCRPNSGSEML
jgi:hypothetical protein